MATTPPARTTDLRDEIATAIATGRELGPEFDTEVTDSPATRMESETVHKREEEQERPRPESRFTRTRKIAGWGALGVIATAWWPREHPKQWSRGRSSP